MSAGWVTWVLYVVSPAAGATTFAGEGAPDATVVCIIVCVQAGAGTVRYSVVRVMQLIQLKFVSE